MDDLSILRRTILWNLEQNVFPSFPSSRTNTYEVRLALETAYREFVFVTAEIENREEVEAHAAKLVEDMWEPAVNKLNTGYGGASEDREALAYLNDIVRDNPIDRAAVVASSPRPPLKP